MRIKYGLCGSCPREQKETDCKQTDSLQSLFSRRQSDAPQKIDKSWICAQVVEGRVDPQSGELIGTLLKGLVQHGQRLRVIAESGVDLGDVYRRDVAPLRDL